MGDLFYCNSSLKNNYVTVVSRRRAGRVSVIVPDALSTTLCVVELTEQAFKKSFDKLLLGQYS